jgi:hypothetical protein
MRGYHRSRPRISRDCSTSSAVSKPSSSRELMRMYLDMVTDTRTNTYRLMNMDTEQGRWVGMRESMWVEGDGAGEAWAHG